jgi:hypothetical protein
VISDDARLRQEHDAVHHTLSDRQSVVHYAHAAVTTLAGLILAGVASKLQWDLGDAYPLVPVPAALFSLVLLGYGTVRWILARRAARREAADIARLTELRVALKLDLPTPTAK